MLDTRFGELISAWTLGWVWGVWLLLPFPTFASAVGYRAMAAVAPETVWGVVFFGVALFQALTLALHWRRKRFVAATLAAMCYGFIAMMIFTANPHGTGWWTYGSLCAANLWAMCRMTRAVTVEGGTWNGGNSTAPG